MEKVDFFITSVLILVTVIITVTVTISLSKYVVVDDTDKSAKSLARYGMFLGWLAVMSVICVALSAYTNKPLAKKVFVGITIFFLVLASMLFAVAASRGESGASDAENVSSIKALHASAYIGLVLSFLSIGYSIGSYHTRKGILEGF